MKSILTVKRGIGFAALIMIFVTCFCRFPSYASETAVNERMFPGSVSDKDAALFEDEELTEEDERQLRVKLDEIDRKYDMSGSGSRMSIELLENPELTVVYDPDSGSFSYTMPNGGVFRSTVPLGGMCCGRAEVETGDMTYIDRLSHDGELYDGETGKKATVSADDPEKPVMTSFGTELPGNYSFRIDSQVRTGMKISTCRVSASFRLIEEGERLRTDVLTAPWGYRIKELRLDGKEVNITRPGFMELIRDGDYAAVFEPDPGKADAGRLLPEYSISFFRDSTPPCVSFSKDIRQGPVEGPLEFYRSEDDTVLRLFWNGQALESVPDPVTATGDYRLEAVDPCGNTFSYEFRIQNKRGMPGRYYILIALVLTVFFVIVVLRAQYSMRIL